MSHVNTILRAYVLLRGQGQPSRAALERLRPQIEGTNKQDRKKIVAGVRYYEQQVHKQRSTASQGAAAAEDTRAMPRVGTAPKLCDNCGTLNWHATTHCQKCNAPLGIITRNVHTRQLTRPQNTRDDLYKHNTTLILRLPQHKHVMELCPQDYGRSLIFGRFDQSGGVIPDVDFTEYNGVELGVSRLHMALTYNERHHNLTIKDMGSANGVYVNGQRLSPYESRLLRTGDRLELGQLVVQVIYAHA